MHKLFQLIAMHKLFKLSASYFRRKAPAVVMPKLFKLIASCFRRKPAPTRYPIIIDSIDDLAKFMPEGKEPTCPPQIQPPQSPIQTPLTKEAARILNANRGGEIIVDETKGMKPGLIANIRISLKSMGSYWTVSRLQVVKRDEPLHEANLKKVHEVVSAVSENRTRN